MKPIKQLSISDFILKNLILPQNFSFEGEVKSFDEKSTKKGNSFGLLELIVEEESETFYLFGDLFLLFKEKLFAGDIINVSGNLERRKFDNISIDFLITNIEKKSSSINKNDSAIANYVFKLNTQVLFYLKHNQIETAEIIITEIQKALVPFMPIENSYGTFLIDNS